MRATTAYRRLRREVHDVLEVGGDVHPMGRVINGFIIVLIFLNAIALPQIRFPSSPRGIAGNSLRSTCSR
jgi:hypothetical protein